MFGRRVACILGPFFALLVLSIAIIGRIPTSKCHCHEQKQSGQDEKNPCPFGKIRGLSAGLVEPVPTNITALRVVFCHIDPSPPEYRSPHMMEHERLHRARDPPAPGV